MSTKFDTNQVRTNFNDNQDVIIVKSRDFHITLQDHFNKNSYYLTWITRHLRHMVSNASYGFRHMASDDRFSPSSVQ